MERIKLLSFMNSVHMAGYTFAHYLLDCGYNNIYIYAKEADLILLESVLLSFRMEKDRLFVKKYISDNNFEFGFLNSEELGNIAFSNIGKIIFEPNDVVVVINIQENKELIVNCKPAKIIQLSNIAWQVYWVTFHGRPIANFAALNPKVHILTFQSPSCPPYENASEWERELYDQGLNLSKFLQLLSNGEKLPAFADKDWTNEEIIEMSTQPLNHIDERGVKIYEEKTSKYVNIKDGHRITVGQPLDYQNTIFILGTCQNFGHTSDDASTLASFLQIKFNTTNMSIKVENYASYNWSIKEYLFYQLYALPVKAGDLVIINAPKLPESFHIEWLDLGKILQRPHDYGEVFSYHYHYNHNGRRAIADALFKKIIEKAYFSKEHALEQITSNYTLHKIRPFGIPELETPHIQKSVCKELLTWLNDLKPLRKNIGAIVMNCNPFTLGHRYLIETAAAQCLHLYIFVVEEEKSEFQFADRIRLVRNGTKDLQNLTILSSGNFIISQNTFSDYFNKDELQDKEIDPSLDIELFAKEIAPILGINIRFAGEEPLDNVTRQYNESMRRILPRYDIEFLEIPRKEKGNSIISASRVRALLKDKNFDEISEIVPQTTLNYLMENFGS